MPEDVGKFRYQGVSNRGVTGGIRTWEWVADLPPPRNQIRVKIMHAVHDPFGGEGKTYQVRAYGDNPDAAFGVESKDFGTYQDYESAFQAAAKFMRRF